MLNRESEYQKAYKGIKKEVKHWTTYSAHRKHSSTQDMKEPAKKAYNFILSLEEDEKSYQEKLELLLDFFQKLDEEEKQKQFMGTSFYITYYRRCEKAIKEIESGLPATVFKIGRR